MKNRFYKNKLVCGDVEGHFRTLFEKVEAINKRKGPFEFILCAGNFFGSNNQEWDDLKAGKIKAPLTTYVLGPNKREHLKFYPECSGELVQDVIFLGKRGQLTGSTGLRIAYLSGVEGNNSTGYSFSKKDISELTNSITDPVDILVTSYWPQGVTKNANKPENLDLSEVGSNSIAFLAKYLKPRYHFSGISGIYYERLPYRNHQVLQEAANHSTRFIGLAPVNNDKKSKWLYAFNITPFCSLSSKEVLDVAGVVTECPYNLEESSDQFFYDMNSSGSRKRSGNDTASSAKKKNLNPVTQDKCWFCLKNPNFEKQLVLSIGDHIYLSLAKGGMVKEHLLIIPINHTESSIQLLATAENEVNRYKEALVKYFHNKEKDVVFFERSLASPHLQIQVVPIPKSKTSGIKENIQQFAATNGLELIDLSKYALVNQLVPPKKHFFLVEIWVNQKKEGRLLHVIQGKFPLQFGRMMLASEDILDIPHCVDWKECKMDPDEELEEVEHFKRSFKPYDLYQ